VTTREIDEVLAIANDAAALIMGVYATAFDVDYKGPNDPVTTADRQANDLICERLTRAFPGVPIVAEESDPSTFAAGFAAPEAWFVDPLDGTREFVEKNGEFCVMIGLARAGRASLGVLVCPAIARTFLGEVGGAAHEVARDGSRRALHVSETASMKDARIVVSRSRRSPALDAALVTLAPREVSPIGSSGIKAAYVATGEADVYLQPGVAGKRWDACGPEAIVRAAGGVFTDVRGVPFEYSSGELENAFGLLATGSRLFDAARAPFQS
jgi:3'(2'), 5'-bisphosphate nucleotidase